MTKLVSRGLRFDRKRLGEIAKAARDGGYANQSAFMRAAIDRELRGREHELDETEVRVAANLDRVAKELRGVRLGHQALFAFVDSLAKTLLTCISEPPADGHRQAVARGRARYDRFLKSVGVGMVGDSHAALSELLRRVQEEL